ncbi:MAG: Ion transport 2 domain protein [Mycobacterium sp.]|nr:Ion transport 2 domain protein [Mycobacterium sp.]
MSAPNSEPRLELFEKRAEWPLAAVAAIFLAAYSVQVLDQPRGWLLTAVHYVLAITWAVFLLDYVARLVLATNRPRWFVRHLPDLAIVALPVLRPLRLLRLLVLVAALQRAIGSAIRGRVLLYTASSAVLLVYASSLAILQVERSQPGSKITTIGDALWWSITTLTTVGYGDESPVSGWGRVIAVAVMVGGIGIVSVITASLASWIVQRVAQEDTAHQAVTAAHIEGLRSDMRQQIGALRNDIELLREAVTGQPALENGTRGF